MANNQFERDDLDGDLVDVNNLPKPPWTLKTLGENVFDELARIAGVGQLTGQADPSLDPRSFGRSRAITLIRNYNLATPIRNDRGRIDEEAEADRLEQVQAYLDEGEALQAFINEGLKPVSGTRRFAKAEKLTGATFTKKESGTNPNPTPLRPIA